MPKNIFITTAAIAAFLAGMQAAAAHAGETLMEEAIKSRPDLSSFYQGLVTTGVINELKSGQPYTVFAPTNEAFAKISSEKYPCFYAPQCREQVAKVLRAHIIKGEKHVADIAKSSEKNGESHSMTLFSIDNQSIPVTEPFKGTFEVEGHKIVKENQLAAGVLYEIGDVLASDRDLAQFQAPQVSVVHTDGANGSANGSSTTTTVVIPPSAR